MTTDSAQIISHAAKRKSEMDLQYAGALLPTEAAALLAADSNAKLVDVRTTPDWFMSDGCAAALTEKQRRRHVIWRNRQQGFLFLCRSGVRSTKF